jgi:hypothetical protein
MYLYAVYLRPVGSHAATAPRRTKKLVEPPKPPELRMNPGEDRVFLKLATVTKIYTQYEITNLEINRAEVLMSEYLMEYREVRPMFSTLLSCLFQCCIYSCTAQRK